MTRKPINKVKKYKLIHCLIHIRLTYLDIIELKNDIICTVSDQTEFGIQKVDNRLDWLLDKLIFLKDNFTQPSDNDKGPDMQCSLPLVLSEPELSLILAIRKSHNIFGDFDPKISVLDYLIENEKISDNTLISRFCI